MPAVKGTSLYQSYFARVVFHRNARLKAPLGIENKKFGTNVARVSDEAAHTFIHGIRWSGPNN
jgi:hypothetical protein